MAERARRKSPRKLDDTGLWEYALRLLGAKGYSTAEIRQRLRKRAASAGNVNGVLERLSRYGYLDDRRFAENYASARLDNGGYGRARVLRDLRRKQIPSEVAETVVESVFQDVDESALIEDYLRRKYRRIDLPKFLSEPKNLSSAYRRLRYAGFSADKAIRVLKGYSARADELDGSEADE